MVLEKTLGSPLDCKEIQAVHPKGNQSWTFIGRTDADDEAPILWPPDEKRPWKRPWCWERLRAGGEGDDRGWDGWMAWQTWWTWVWINSCNQSHLCNEVPLKPRRWGLEHVRFGEHIITGDIGTSWGGHRQGASFARTLAHLFHSTPSWITSFYTKPVVW